MAPLRLAEDAALVASDDDLGIAPLGQADREELCRVLLEPDTAADRFFRGKRPKTVEECIEMLDQGEGRIRHEDGGDVLVVWFPARRVEDGEIVGYVQVQAPDGLQPEVVVYISTAWRRRGYATKVLRLVVDLLLSNSDSKWVVGVAAEDNPSKGIIEMLGFQDQGPTFVDGDHVEHTWIITPQSRTWA